MSSSIHSTQTPEMRSQRGRVAALARLAQSTPQAVAAPAQRGLRQKFAREVVADAAAKGETLSPEEQVRRAQAKFDAHMAKMTLARMQRAAERRELAAAEKARREHASQTARLLTLTRPAALCPWCVREAGEKWPRDATSLMCERHEAELRAQVERMRRPGSPDPTIEPTPSPTRGRKGGRRAD